MKHSFKRAMALALAAVMMLSMAACGKSGDSTGDKTTDTTTPEYTYAAEFKTISSDDMDDESLSPSAFLDDGYIAYTYETIKADDEDEDGDESYACVLYYVGFDGKKEKLVNYQPVATPENTNDYGNYYSGSYIDGMLTTDDGKIVMIEDVYTSWNDAPAGVDENSEDYWSYYNYEESYYIRWLEKDGSEISTAEVQVDTSGEYLSAYDIELDDQNNVVCLMGGDTVVAIKADGTIAYSITSDDYIYDVLKLSDNRIAVFLYSGDTREITLIDTEAKAFGESYKIDTYINSSTPGSNGYDLYYSSGANFYGLKLEEGTSDKLFSWLACDVNGDAINGFNVLSDGSVVAITMEYDRSLMKTTNELVTVKQVPYDSVPHKEVLTLGCLYDDYYTNQMIVKFNRSNDKYRIEVIDYSEYNTDDDYSAGQTKFNTEIMAGNVPDIINISNLNYTQLASKGIIEDLYPYIDADSEMSRDDFFPSVLKANEVDGKLCSTVAGFYISTVLGASSVVGDTPGWNYEQFAEALASMPEGCEPFDYYTTRDGILQTCLALDMDEYVNWSTGECKFDSQDFIDLLEFAAQFPETFDWDNYDYSEDDSTANRIAQGKQMLMATSVYSLDDLFYSNYDNYFGGSYTFIGYPTANGTGNMIGLDSGGLAISSKSQNKDAAWEFIRQFMTADYQSSYVWSLPSRLDLFNARAKELTTVQYEKDNDGNYVLDEDGEKIPVVQFSSYNSDTDEYEDVYCLDQSKIDTLIELINSTDKVANYDDDIFSIVSEQAAAFFSGQKSAAEVAKLVQSKANIFVNEQR